MTDQMTVRTARDRMHPIPAPVTARWGPWRLDREQRVLRATAVCPARNMYDGTVVRVLPSGRQRLAVDLDPLTSAAAIVDAIVTISRATDDDAVTAGFVRAVDDVLRPLATVSSWGRPRRLTRREIRDLVSRAGSGEEEGTS